MIIVATSFAYAQTAVRTETASNKYLYYNAATLGDTVLTTATSIAGGSAIRNYNTRGFVVGIKIGAPIASDTIILKNGVDTVYYLVQPASAPFVYGVDLNTGLDTSLVFIQKKNSRSTLIYRLRY